MRKKLKKMENKKKYQENGKSKIRKTFQENLKK